MTEKILIAEAYFVSDPSWGPDPRIELYGELEFEPNEITVLGWAEHAKLTAMVDPRPNGDATIQVTIVMVCAWRLLRNTKRQYEVANEKSRLKGNLLLSDNKLIQTSLVLPKALCRSGHEEDKDKSEQSWDSNVKCSNLDEVTLWVIRELRNAKI